MVKVSETATSEFLSQNVVRCPLPPEPRSAMLEEHWPPQLLVLELNTGHAKAYEQLTRYLYPFGSSSAAAVGRQHRSASPPLRSPPLALVGRRDHGTAYPSCVF